HRRAAERIRNARRIECRALIRNRVLTEAHSGVQRSLHVQENQCPLHAHHYRTDPDPREDDDARAEARPNRSLRFDPRVGRRLVPVAQVPGHPPAPTSSNWIETVTGPTGYVKAGG